MNWSRVWKSPCVPRITPVYSAKSSRAGPSSPPIQTVTVSKMEDNGEKSPWLPSKVSFTKRRTLRYGVCQCELWLIRNGSSIDVRGQLRNEQKKKRELPGELERRKKELICDDAYCAAEKDGGVWRDLMSRGKSAIFVRSCTSATACGAWWGTGRATVRRE